MQFRDFLVVLRTRWRVVAACALLVLGATAAYTLTLVPTYTATARVYFSATGGDPAPGQQSRGGPYIITSADLNTYVEVLRSPSVLEPLRAALGLPPNAPLNVNASVPPTASVLDITATDSTAEGAARIANAVGPQLASVAIKFSPLLANAGQNVQATSINPAVAPGSPTTPDVRRNLTLGLLAGLAIGIGVAFGRHALDTKVRSENDVKTLSDRPLLSAIPFDKNAKGRPLTLVTDPHGMHAEAIRRLRTNLLFVDVTTGKHSFVVTSAMPGEGKTSTVINLAMALSDTGARVLLVDGDLRNPSVARTMGLEGGVGLTTILLGAATVDDVVQQWRDSSLYVLPAGQIPPNPSEILGSEPMETLFDHLTKEFDYVLVDSPPLLPVIDAVVINKLVGGLLFVVAADRTRKRDLQSALKSLSTVGVNAAGFALNMVATGNSDPYRYAYYRDGGATGKSRTERRARSKQNPPRATS
ncbi:MAG: polysaccharide biosynthesis tyrosine autokinase [Actinomycetota bacterium]|nr:polysaccharide biosynthesis tyrosine autokinase [Actinomycetota bacterium]